jgi:predicted nucleic acid-binding protein
VEVCAALSRRQKSGRIATAQFQKSIKRLRRDFTERLNVTASTESIVIEALRLAQVHALRGYDALQLATALEANRRRSVRDLPALTLVSSDNELNRAANSEGISVEDPNNR